MIENNNIKFDQLKSNLQQNPDSLIFARVAEALLVRGKVDEAIRICEEGIRKHPYYVTGHMVLGKCYLQKKMFDLAEKEFKRVLLFEPKHIAAHKFTGDLMKEAGWAEACQKSYAEILKIDPLDSKISSALENIKREVVSDQRVVSPAEGSIPKPVPEKPKDEKTIIAPDITPFGESDEPKTITTAPIDVQPIETTAINIDDDLFADDPPQITQKADKGKSAPIATEGVTSILDDIFEDSSSTEPGQRQDDAESETMEALPETGPVETLDDDILQGIHVKPYDPDAPTVGPEITPDKSEIDAEETPNLSEETIEFNKIESLEDAALENLKPVEEGEIEFVAGDKNTEGDDFFDALDAEFNKSTTAPVDPESKPAEEAANKEETPFEIEQFKDEKNAAEPEIPKPSEASAEQIFDEVFSEQPALKTQQEETAPAEMDNTEISDAEIDDILAGEESLDLPEINEADADIPALEDIPIKEDDEQSRAVAKDEQDQIDSMIAAVDEASEKKPQELKKAEPSAPMPAAESHDSSAAEIDKERIVTPTLGEIYAAQGQYAKAMNVFEILSKKDPENKMYQEKVTFLKQRLSESSDA